MTPVRAILSSARLPLSLLLILAACPRQRDPRVGWLEGGEVRGQRGDPGVMVPGNVPVGPVPGDPTARYEMPYPGMLPPAPDMTVAAAPGGQPTGGRILDVAPLPAGRMLITERERDARVIGPDGAVLFGVPLNDLQIGAASPDGSFAVLGMYQAAFGVPLTGAGAGAVAWTVRHHENVRAVAWPNDKTVVFTVGDDAQAHDAATGALRWSVDLSFDADTLGQPDSAGPLAMRAGPNGSELWVGRAGALQRLDLTTGAPGTSWPVHADRLDAAAFSADGATLVTGGWDRRLLIHEVQEAPVPASSPTLVLRCSLPTDAWVVGVALRADGMALVGLVDGQALLVDTRTEGVAPAGATCPLVARTVLPEEPERLAVASDGAFLVATAGGVYRIP